MAESVEPREYRVWLTPGEQVHPVAGADYSQVPTHPWPRDGDQAASRGGPPPNRWAWKVQRTRPDALFALFAPFLSADLPK
ncbi:hypothetical protein [Streptomyces phaeofaciens]|uniref:hypothetical protein n=1 Tax=Streptomyces phaeofaciens TaxID=68254 RepID=UPI0036CF9828